MEIVVLLPITCAATIVSWRVSRPWEHHGPPRTASGSLCQA